jgi:hypothetical protein
MTDTVRTTTLSGNAVPEHACDGFDCYPCLKADQDAAARNFTTAQKAKKFAATKRAKSVTASARPVFTSPVTPGVAGDVPPALPNLRWGNAYDHAGTKTVGLTVNELPAEPTPLQRPLEGVGPAHLSQATVAKGFILAGNAYFTVRSLKTGTRYTYRVNRARCSRCGKLDCSCWAHPTYFVALLTGPDNTADYTYLGMLREGRFAATRATGAQAAGKPFAAFRWVWERLARGEYPAAVEIWHEGRCGRCGRRLTVPESVERGIGPECAAKGGF